MKKLLLALALSLVSAPALANDTAILDKMDARYDQTADVAQKLWDWAEVGYQEEKSSALLKDTLAAQGFSVKSGVADIPTAFIAEYGKGGPVIAILAEYDALPGINQDAQPERAQIDGKDVAHACGHNLFAAGSLGAALGLKDWLETTGTPGRIRLYGTPPCTGMPVIIIPPQRGQPWPTVQPNSGSKVSQPTPPGRRTVRARRWTG